MVWKFAPVSSCVFPASNNELITSFVHLVFFTAGKNSSFICLTSLCRSSLRDSSDRGATKPLIYRRYRVLFSGFNAFLCRHMGTLPIPITICRIKHLFALCSRGSWSTFPKSFSVGSFDQRNGRQQDQFDTLKKQDRIKDAVTMCEKNCKKIKLPLRTLSIHSFNFELVSLEMIFKNLKFANASFLWIFQVDSFSAAVDTSLSGRSRKKTQY